MMTLPFSADSNPFILAKTKRRTHGETVHAAVYTDDWGRLWGGQADNKTGHPVGALHPIDWRVPHKDLIPPSKHHKFSPQTRRDYRLRVDVQGWIADHVGALDAWHRERENMVRSDPNAAALASQQDQTALDRMVGDKPLSVKFLQAMLPRDRQGRLVTDNPQPEDYNRASGWVLGKKDRYGQPYPQPEWANAAVMATLQRTEAKIAAELQIDGAEFLNPDEDAYIADDDAAETLDRLEGAAPYQSFDDLPPKPEKRSHHKKVNNP